MGKSYVISDNIFKLLNDVSINANAKNSLFNILLPPEVFPEHLETAIIKCILAEVGINNTNVKNFADGLDLLHKNDKVFRKLQEETKNLGKIYADSITGDYCGKIYYTKLHKGYLLEYANKNIFKIWQPLRDLLVGGCLPNNITVADIGCGPGSLSLGIVEFYKHLARLCSKMEFSIKIVLVDEESAFLKYAQVLLREESKSLLPNLHITLEDIIHENINQETDFELFPMCDLIAFGNFYTFNEGKNDENAIALMNKIKERLRPDGAIIIIEPAYRSSIVSLDNLVQQLIEEGTWTEYSPYSNVCAGSFEYYCRSHKCFAICYNLSNLHKEFRYILRKAEAIKYCYVVMRQDGKNKKDILSENEKIIPLVELDLHKGEVIDINAYVTEIELNKNGNSKLTLCDGTNCNKIQVTVNLNFLNEPCDIKIGDIIEIKNVENSAKAGKGYAFLNTIRDKTKVYIKG